MRVVFTAAAQADLLAIADYIARDNPARAKGFVQDLRAVALRLAAAPQGFPLVPRFAHLGVRRRGFGNYLILYQVRGEAVVVLHVVHGARDYEALLEGP